MHKITLFLALILASQIRPGQAQDATSAQNDDACGCCGVEEVVVVSNMSDAPEPENTGSSTQPGRYLKITFVSPCELGEAIKATATAYGTGSENVVVTLKSSEGTAKSKKHSVTGDFPTKNAKTLNFTATASGWKKDTAIAGTGGRFNRTAYTAPPGLLDYFEADLKNFTLPWGTVSVKAKPTAASGEQWDCCLNGEVKDNGFKRATAGAQLSVEATINTPASFNGKSSDYTIAGYTVSGKVSIGVVPTVGMTVGLKGTYTKKCDDTNCLNLTGALTAKGKVALEGEAKLIAAKGGQEEPVVIASVDLFFASEPV